MTDQGLFLLGLHIFGVLVGVSFRKHIPFPFICLTGFIWGSLIWVVAAVFFLIISVAYSPMNMGLLVAVIIVSLAIIQIRGGTWRLNYTELAWLTGTMFAYVVVVSVAVRFNYSWPTHDSAVQIMLGRVIAQDGYVYWPQAGMVSFGLFVPLLHSISVFLGQDYLWAAHPVFAFSFFLAFCYLCQRATRHSIPNGYTALVLALLVSLALFTASLMIVQIFYIHNNLISATYLFVAVGTSWLAVRERNNSWLIFTMAALTGFSLSRLESPLFALAFLALLINTGQLSYRLRLCLNLPYLIFMVLWYLKLMLFTQTYYDIILNPRNVVAMMALLIAFGVVVGASRFRWVEHLVLPRLHLAMIGALLLILGFFFVQQPEQMLKCVISPLKNAYYYGNWGPIWIVFLILLVFSATQPRIPYEKLFTFFIIAFSLLLLSLGGMRPPYRLGYGDSGNRMLTHILPIICFYVLLKYGHNFHADASEQIALIKTRLRIILATTGVILLVVSLLWFIKIA
jgi:hypothetical protein